MLNYRSLYGKIPYREYWGKWGSLVLKYLRVPRYERFVGEIEARWFKHAGADTIGKVKPHPEAFKYALEILRVKPEEALFIGDKIDDDYKGAEEAGITLYSSSVQPARQTKVQV